MKKLILVLIALTVCGVVQAQVTSQPSPACPAPTATIPVGSNITLTWVAPTQNTDGSQITGPITYNVYSIAGAHPVLIAGGVTGTSNPRTNLNAGTPCYAVTAVVGGVESGLSNTGSINVAVPPPPTPAPPTKMTCSLALTQSSGTSAAVSGNCTIGS